MEAVSKVESFAHNSHTTKYPPHPQYSWNSDFLSWDKQLASSDIVFHSVCQLFQWCTAPTSHLFRLLSARLIFGLCCLISLFSGAKQNLWCHLRIPFTSMKLALVFKGTILICLLPFWPRSIMICLYVEFFNYPSVRAGSRTKLNRGTGWHNVMQTSYQLVEMLVLTVILGLHVALYLHVIQSWSIPVRISMSKSRSMSLDTWSIFCMIIVLPFLRLAVGLWKMFILISQFLLFSLRQPMLIYTSFPHKSGRPHQEDLSKDITAKNPSQFH